MQTPPKKRFACDSCVYVTKESGALTVHKRRHTGEKPYKCDECESAFSSSSDLRSHKHRHSSDKPFSCDECDKMFKTKARLAVHKSFHAGVKKFHCLKCQSSFVTSWELVIHNRTHTGEKPFNCNQCTASFIMTSQLKVHMRSHTGEKPYECNVCQKRFAGNEVLKLHLRIHSGEKPYKCDKCDYSFKQSSALTSHQKTHSNEKPYACSHCAFRTAYARSLKDHEQLHERRQNFQFICKMQEGGIANWQIGDLKCSIRCETETDLLVHMERNHTIDGLGKKLHSETKLAEFLTLNHISFDRDWVNRLNFKGCKIEGRAFSARPDFFLPEFSAKLNAIVLIGNDEFAHRSYPCDMKRTWNIVASLQQTPDFANVPIVYFRFNPHGYYRDDKFFSPTLATGHLTLLHELKSVSVDNLKPGLNLIYIHYDTQNSRLKIFENPEENDFASVFEDCVLKIVS